MDGFGWDNRSVIIESKMKGFSVGVMGMLSSLAALVPVFASSTPDISSTLQNILANTDRSNLYTYPTDLTREIVPARHTSRLHYRGKLLILFCFRKGFILIMITGGTSLSTPRSPSVV